MAAKSDSSAIIRWIIGTTVSVMLALVGATYVLVTRIDGIDEKDGLRVAQISYRVKTIESFLKDKYPDFANFARKESLYHFAQQIDRFVFVPPGAQRTSATLKQIYPQTHSIAFQTVTGQTENLQVPPDVDVLVFVPNLRRVRRVSGPAASSVLTKAMERGSAAVVVYGSDRKIKSIYLAQPSEP